MWLWTSFLACVASTPPTPLLNRLVTRLGEERGVFETPEMVVLGPDAFQDEWIEQVELPDSGDEAFLRVAGLADGREDVLDALRGVAGVEIGGWYESERHRIVVPQGHDQDEDVLLHELAHARQGHLGVWAGEAQPRAVQDVVRVLAEGDAMLTAAVVQRGAAADELVVREGRSDSTAPPLVRYVTRAIRQPYGLGLGVVQRLRREGGWSRVDAQLLDPPVSVTQLLAPRSESPGYVWLPVPEGFRSDCRVTLDVFGSAALMDAIFPMAGASVDVAEAWAGDQFLCLSRGDDEGFVWRTRWNSVEDARVFHGLWFGWHRPEQEAHVEIRGREVVLVSGVSPLHAAAVSEAAWAPSFVPIHTVEELRTFYREHE